MDYPKNTDILESFQCRETASFSYKYSLILPMLKALSLSRKVNLRMNQLGVLNVQVCQAVYVFSTHFTNCLISLAHDTFG